MTVENAGSMPSIDNYTVTRQSGTVLNVPVYVSNGASDICKVTWNVENEGKNNTIDHYEVILYCYGIDSGSEFATRTFNVGLSTEFYIKAEMLNDYLNEIAAGAYNEVDLEFPYRWVVQVSAISAFNYDNCHGGAADDVYIIDAKAFYIKTYTAAGEPIFKRSLCFVKVNNEWRVCQNAFANVYGLWRESDEDYEALVDSTGALVLDSDGQSIFTY